MGCQPNSYKANCCLYGRCCRSFYLVLHLTSIPRIYFIYLGIARKVYWTIAVPSLCLVNYVFLYFFIGFRKNKLILVNLAIEVCSMVFYCYQIYYYFELTYAKDSPFAEHSMLTQLQVAFWSTIVVIFFKLTFIPVLYRGYVVLGDPNWESDYGLEFLTVGLISHLFFLVILALAGGGSSGPNCSGGCGTCGASSRGARRPNADDDSAETGCCG